MDAEVLSMSEAEISVANAEVNREPESAQTFEALASVVSAWPRDRAFQS
jgi:hypothetical protein